MTVARAYKNHGRWIVECECRMAFEVDPGVKSIRCAPPNELHRIRDYCGAAYTVVWPDHTRIDRILGQRLLVNQNWVPGEPLSLLVAENVEHGCGLPEGESGV